MATVNPRKRTRKGFALLLTLLILPLMAMLAFTLTRMGVSNLQTSRVRVDSRQAAYVSEAGAEEAYQILLKYPAVSTSATSGFPSRGVTGANVIVTNNNIGTGTGPITAPNGATVPRGFAYVQSIAKVDGVTRSTGYLVRLQPVADPLLQGGWVSLDPANINGNYSMDAFDSDVGPYNQSESRAGGTGNVTTRPYNAVAASNGAVTAGGNTAIYGSLKSNLGADVPVITAPSDPDVTYPSGWVIDPATTLGAGATEENPYVVVVKGDLNVKKKLTIVGPTKIYVSGSLQINGQGEIVNPTLKAKNLFIYGTGSDTAEWKINGGANAYAVIYAPTRPVKMNGGFQMAGAIIGKTIQAVGTADLHQDLALAKPPAGQPPAVMYRQRF